MQLPLADLFQSPSLRGSGRFLRICDRLLRICEFQSPSLRGSGRFASALRAFRGAVVFQSPSLRGSGRFLNLVTSRVVGGRVSIPFIAGQWSLPAGDESPAEPAEPVSIPFIAGQWSLLPRTTPSSLFGVLLRKRRLPCDHIICTRLPF